MKTYSEEILTYELYKRDEIFEIHIPVQNLFNPKFLIKENNLYIYLFNYTHCYILNNIPKETVKEIKKENVLIIEKNFNRYQIKLNP